MKRQPYKLHDTFSLAELRELTIQVPKEIRRREVEEKVKGRAPAPGKPKNPNARIQLRGTCQCCGRVQAVLPTGKMTKHGYTVKNGGFNGICYGEDYPPMEKSIEQTTRIIEQIQTDVEKLTWQDAYALYAKGFRFYLSFQFLCNCSLLQPRRGIFFRFRLASGEFADVVGGGAVFGDRTTHPSILIRRQERPRRRCLLWGVSQLHARNFAKLRLWRRGVRWSTLHSP